ncbi:hypothetical protein H7X46_00280 [Pseudonocardia sp. C8]|uniref:hypothetical protein n=1 Tax=Pseudonocardia sp. C8 TaxID=2762759 RepID=UPI001642BC49|nr:hypothetical protein [Pseudonocardia sp. C8]MBC3189506.1 hypothetical protein [Pseudonocardia sp. C8]
MTAKGRRKPPGSRAPGGRAGVPVSFRTVESSRDLLDTAGARQGRDRSELIRRYCYEGLQRDGLLSRASTR